MWPQVAQVQSPRLSLSISPHDVIPAELSSASGAVGRAARKSCSTANLAIVRLLRGETWGRPRCNGPRVGWTNGSEFILRPEERHCRVEVRLELLGALGGLVRQLPLGLHVLGRGYRWHERDQRRHERRHRSDCGGELVL